MSDIVQWEFRSPEQGGLVRIDADGTVTPEAKVAAIEPIQTVVSPAPVTRTPVTPRTVVQAAKARVKEIRQELKNKRALERELAQLENLLKAARKPTHLAEVRQLAPKR